MGGSTHSSRGWGFKGVPNWGGTSRFGNRAEFNPRWQARDWRRARESFDLLIHSDVADRLERSRADSNLPLQIHTIAILFLRNITESRANWQVALSLNFLLGEFRQARLHEDCLRQDRT